MILADFIRTHLEEIVREWEAYAGTCLPAAKDLDQLRLRDHASELLKFVADDMESPQTEAQQTEKGQGRAPQKTHDSEAEKHAVLRVADGFTIDQVVGEFRALRASVLRLSAKSGGVDPSLIEITRFNESIDEMLAESVARHTRLVADDLREGIRQKDRFIATLSHELRNPVSAISASTQLLRHTEDPFVERIGGILARQVGHLTCLVDDLLELGRISSDRVTLKTVRADLRSCVLEIAGSLKKKATS